LTTVDPIKGEKCSKMEPLKELRKYKLLIPYFSY